MTDEAEILVILQAEIAARLRPVCAGMSEEGFRQLVRDVAAVKLKYDIDLDAGPSPRRRSELKSPDDPRKKTKD